MTLPRHSAPRQILHDAIQAKCMLAPSPVDSMLAIAKKAGIGIKAIARAAGGGPLSANDHLRLCAALEIDPMAGFGRVAYGMNLAFPDPADFDPHFLALGLQLRQRRNRHNDTQAARVIGIKLGTILRIKAGTLVPVGATLRACRYIGVHPFAYCGKARWMPSKANPPRESISGFT